MVSGRPLRVGVQLPEVEREVRWSELRAMAKLAEDVGFDSIWVGDHLLYRNPGEPAKGPWEAWSTLAAVAAVTERVALGPLVAATAFHSPAMLAKKAATVDEISGGRLVLGLGAGWNRVEFDAFGFPYDHRAARFAEALAIVCALLREGAVDFEGAFYSARDCELVPRSPRPGGPPIVVGSRGPRILRAALPLVDGWNAWHAWFGNRPGAELDALLAELDAACADVGRAPGEIERTVAVLIGLSGAAGRLAGDAGKRGVEPIGGPPEAVAATLARYAEHGITHVQLVLDPITAASIESMGDVLEQLDEASA